MNFFILFAVLAFLPLTAAAQVRDARSMLQGSMQALGLAGFAGMQDGAMPQAPSAVSVSPAGSPIDETAQSVAALVEAAQKSGGERTSVGDTLRELGIAFNGESFPVKDIQVTESDSIKLFSVTTVRGKNDILVEEVKKVGGKKELRSYLISIDGKLLGAAVTRKENGAYVAESVPLTAAEAGYREQFDFWIRYYRANLKKP